MSKTKLQRHRGLSPGITSLARRLIAENPEFVLLKPGEFRPAHYYIRKNAAKILRRARKNRRRNSRFDIGRAFCECALMAAIRKLLGKTR